jgi:vancomycin aglycone glucosyltransferase
MYDQHYWAKRVHQLGMGTAHALGAPSADSLTEALSNTLKPDVAACARAVAASVRTDGPEIAERRLIDEA